jgi:hypothetical protein
MNKTRLSKLGDKHFKELDKAVDLVIHTKCPSKWKLIDQETGEVYIGKDDFSDNKLHWEKVLNKESDKNEEYVYVKDQEPPKDEQLIVVDPNGHVYLATWRSEYKIFSCQLKSENSIDWLWKNV